MKRKLISVLVSGVIIGLLWWRIDAGEIIAVLSRVDAGWLGIAIAVFFPIVLATAWRLYYVVRLKTRDIRYRDSLSLTLAAAVMNLVLPSKMGDLAKGVFLRKHGNMGGAAAFSIVLLEKANDVLALVLWCGLGLLFYSREGVGWIWLATILMLVFVFGCLMVFSRRWASWCLDAAVRVLPPAVRSPVESLSDAWTDMHQYVDSATKRRILAASTALWLVHLLQIWFFMLALHIDNVGFATSAGLTALAIFFGLLPLTFMGVGTRDAALVYLYAPYFPAATAAALGVLTLVRYILPALFGIPVFSRYLAEIRLNDAKDALRPRSKQPV